MAVDGRLAGVWPVRWRSFAYLSDPLVDRDGDDDEDAHGEGLVEHVQAGEGEAVAEHADDQGAEQGAPDGPRPPKRLVPPITTAVIESRFRSTPALGLAALVRPIWIQAPTARMAPGGEVDAHQHSVDGDAGQAGGLLVVADRVDVPAPGGLARMNAMTT